MLFKNFKISVLAAVVILSLGFSPLVFAGGNSDGGSGGGGPRTVSAGALKLLIEGGGLKRAMLNYLSTMQVNKIEDAGVRATMSRMLGGRALEADIQIPGSYFVAKLGEQCVDAFNNSVPASTAIGKIGAPVCFDVSKLVLAYEKFSSEEVLIHLASLAFHEHVHHFQKVTHDLKEIQRNEDEANAVAGYILITAKYMQIPVLEWAPDAPVDQFTEIRRMYDVIQAKERLFLSVRPGDYANYADYIGREDRGLFRLLPREKYDGKLSVQGGGSYYSFYTKSHDYQHAAQIALEQGRLSSGFAGCDYGMFVDLGQVPLDQVTLSSARVSFLAEFQAISNNEPKIRMQQSAASHGFSKDGVTHTERVEFSVGQAFAVRTVLFDDVDELVAIKIVKAEKDGSLVIAWKRLKSFPTPTCGGGAGPARPDISPQ